MIKPIALSETRRTARRQNFLIRATLAGAQGDCSGRVRDLSADGLKIELDAVPEPPLRKGDTVTVQLRGIGPVQAQVVWRRSQWHGLRFARAINPEKALKPVGKGETTPDYVKPVLVPGRSLKYSQGL